MADPCQLASQFNASHQISAFFFLYDESEGSISCFCSGPRVLVSSWSILVATQDVRSSLNGSRLTSRLIDFSDVNSVHVTLNRVNNSWNKLSYHIFHAYRFPMVLCFWLFESVGAVRIASIWPRRPDPLDLNKTTPALPSELEVLNKTPRGVIPNTKVKTLLKYLCFIFVVEHSIIVRSLSGVEQ